MTGGQEKNFSTLGPKLRDNRAQQYYGDKTLQIRVELSDYHVSPGHDAAEAGGDPLVAAVINGLTRPGKLLDSLPAAALQVSLDDVLALLVDFFPAQMQNITNLRNINFISEDSKH